MAEAKRVKPEKALHSADETIPSAERPGRPRKPRLGQTFLADGAAAIRIVEALGDISQRTVVELGPGRAALTNALSRRARRLIAIELDRVLAAQLRMHFARANNVEIIEADLLSVDLSTVLGPRPGSSVVGLAPLIDRALVIGNLPYYITSDILLHLFHFHQYLERIVIMVQLEVAQRIAAKPGSREYGLLSATAQLYTRVEKLFTLPPGAFVPPPKVHSAVLRLTVAPRFEELQVAPAEFIRFLKQSFAQKRKTLANNLRLEYDAPAVVAALSQARVKADVRAEAISLEKAAIIFKALKEQRK